MFRMWVGDGKAGSIMRTAKFLQMYSMSVAQYTTEATVCYKAYVIVKIQQ